MNPKTDYAIITCAACGIANQVPLGALTVSDGLIIAGECLQCQETWGMVFYLKERGNA